MGVFKEIEKADGSGVTTFYRLSDVHDTVETDDSEGTATVIDYNAAQNKPSINGVTLVGNKTSEDLGLQPAGDYITNDEADAKFIDEDELEAKNYVNETRLQEAIANIDHFHREIVNALPVTGQDNVLYMVRKQGSGEDIFNEYIWVGKTASETGYEFIGTTATDLTDYYQKDEVDDLLDGKVDKVSGRGLSEQNYTLSEKTKLAGLHNYDDTELQVKVANLHNYDDTDLQLRVGDLEVKEEADSNAISTIQDALNKKMICIRLVEQGDGWTWMDINGSRLTFDKAQAYLGQENCMLFVEQLENDGKVIPAEYKSETTRIRVLFKDLDSLVHIMTLGEEDLLVEDIITTEDGSCDFEVENEAVDFGARLDEFYGNTSQEVIAAEAGTEVVDKSISINDVNTSKENYITLKGDMAQKTTTGKNLIPNNLSSDSRSGITYAVREDGTIKITGTATARVEPYLFQNSSNPLVFQPGTYKNTSSRMIVLYAQGYIGFAAGATQTFTEAKTVTQVYFRIENGETNLDEIYYPQIISITESNEQYEPYSGGKRSPNPDYRQEIEVVRGNGLPTGYKQVEYLESDGNQYIDTGINADSTLGFSAKLQQISGRFGSYKSIDGNDVRHHLYDGGKWGYGSAGSVGYGVGHTSSEVYEFECNYYNSRKVKDNGTIINLPSVTFDIGMNFWLFQRNAGYAFKGKIYYFKMTKGKKLVRDFIPCYRISDNAIGMYDTVQKVFYQNQGTGSFIKGPDVEYDKKIKVFGKNWVNMEWPIVKRESATYSNITTTSNSLAYTVSGNIAGYAGYVIPVKVGETYTLSFTTTSGGMYLVHLDEPITEVGTNYGSYVTSGATFVASRPYIGLWLMGNANTGTPNPAVSNILLEKGSTVTSFEPYTGADYLISLKDIELCKINDYHDYIYKKRDDWYLHKEIGKVAITANDNITHYNGMHWVGFNKPADSVMYQNFNRYQLFMERAYYSDSNNDIYSYQTGLGSGGMGIMCASTDTIEVLKPLIDGSLMYYPLATPTDTLITDSDLVSQLNSLYSFIIYPTTNIESGGNGLLPYINLKYNAVTPSPSPDRISEVKVVKGNNNIKAYNKNLFDGVLELGNWSTNDGSKLVNSSFIINSHPIPVKELTNYKLSLENENIDMYVFEYKKDMSYNLTARKLVRGESYLTTERGTAYINFRPVNQNTNLHARIQVEPGTTKTEYVLGYTQTFPLSLGQIELCKIGNYKDKIYKQNNTWYLHKEITKVILNGTEGGWQLSSNYAGLFQETGFFKNLYDSQEAFCDYYKNVVNPNITANDRARDSLSDCEFTFRWGDVKDRIYIKDNAYNTVGEFLIALRAHPITIYYALATPTDTEITDTTLLTQLENLQQITQYKHTYIDLIPATDNEIPDAQFTYISNAVINASDRILGKDTYWNDEVPTSADLPSNAEEGEIRIVQDTQNVYIYDGYEWIPFDKGGEIDLSNYLAKDNTTAWVPSGAFNPATKKYVDDSVGGVFVPTKTSQLTNDSNFIGKNSNDLTYYYTKTQTYTKSEVDALIGGGGGGGKGYDWYAEDPRLGTKHHARGGGGGGGGNVSITVSGDTLVITTE